MRTNGDFHAERCLENFGRVLRAVYRSWLAVCDFDYHCCHGDDD